MSGLKLFLVKSSDANGDDLSVLVYAHDQNEAAVHWRMYYDIAENIFPEKSWEVSTPAVPGPIHWDWMPSCTNWNVEQEVIPE